jgi:hypothetical protein
VYFLNGGEPAHVVNIFHGISKLPQGGAPKEESDSEPEQDASPAVLENFTQHLNGLAAAEKIDPNWTRKIGAGYPDLVPRRKTIRCL